jgi:pimeloyl-ACP methyl ester carboxylesterase
MTHLRLSKMIEHVRSCIGGVRDRAVLFGSSLGGLTACRVAEEDARVSALVLLAPAFRMIERWRTRIGEEAWAEWQRVGWLETIDYAKGGMSKVDFGFAEDAGLVDSMGDGWPDVRVPTLIVHGWKDDVVSVTLSRDFARGKAHVRLVEVDDGHELAASLPTIFKESERFLAPFFGAVRDT